MNIDPYEAKIVGKKYPMGKVSTMDNKLLLCKIVLV